MSKKNEKWNISFCRSPAKSGVWGVGMFFQFVSSIFWCHKNDAAQKFKTKHVVWYRKMNEIIKPTQPQTYLMLRKATDTAESFWNAEYSEIFAMIWVKTLTRGPMCSPIVGCKQYLITFNRDMFRFEAFGLLSLGDWESFSKLQAPLFCDWRRPCWIDFPFIFNFGVFGVRSTVAVWHFVKH